MRHTNTQHSTQEMRTEQYVRMKLKRKKKTAEPKKEREITYKASAKKEAHGLSKLCIYRGE